MIKDIQLGYPVMTKEEFMEQRVGGSIMYHDAEILYAFVRHLKPADILELGAFVGVSTNVLVKAVRENGHGHIVSLDKFAPGQEFIFGKTTDTTIGWVGRHRSELVPDSDLDNVTMVTCEVVKYCKSLPDHSFDFIFEDTDHHQETIRALVPEFKRILRPGGIVLFHNIDIAGVERGFRDAGVWEKVQSLKKINGSSIGLLVGDEI